MCKVFILFSLDLGKMYTKLSLENLKGRDHLEDLDINRMIILEWISNKHIGRVWIGFIWLRRGTSATIL
jgi:hypothetical protein